MQSAASVARIPARRHRKRRKVDVAAFEFQLIDHLLQLREALEEGSYTPRLYTFLYP